MKKKNTAAAVMAAIMLFSSCSGGAPEVKPAFVEQTQSSTSAEPTSATSESTEETEKSAETSETVTSAASVTEETTVTESETETTEPFVTTSGEPAATLPPNTGYEDEALKTVTAAQAPAQNTVYNYDKMVPSEKYKDFYSKCVFVGDSICLGFKAYEVLPAKQVCAQGSTAARNILEFTFKANGYTGDLISCLKKLDPKYIVFSMGMNDVNMTSAEKFCENYGYLLSLTEKALPKAQLIVCSVTPVIYGSKFCTNTRIDSFNATLKKYLDATGKWIYADIAHGLKDEYNGLKSRYNGGDGIHLSGIAYKAILYQIAERVLDNIEYDADGNVVHLEETAAETTKAPEESETKKTSKTKKTSETTKKTKKTKKEEIPEETSAEVSDRDADTTKEPE